MAAFVVSAASKAIIKETIGAVANKGPALTAAFYKRMFTDHPELMDTFNMSHQKSGDQPQALFDSVAMSAMSVVSDGVQKLPMSAVECICHKHCSVAITADQYAIVGKELLATIEAELGVGPEILAAWGELYGQVADAMIGIEAGLYAKSVADGWPTGLFDVQVAKIHRTCENFLQMSLAPAAGGPKFGKYTPGQYISVWAPKGSVEGGHRQPRQYSLTSVCDHDATLDIGVSVVKGGKVSNYLNKKKEGDKLTITAPFGPLKVPQGCDNLVVMSSGGAISGEIGVLRSILLNKVVDGPKHVQWVYGSDSGAHHPYRSELMEFAAKHKRFKRRVFYTSPRPSDIKGKHYTHDGEIDIPTLIKDGVEFNSKTQVMMCGSKAGIGSLLKPVMDAGVPRDNIQVELFTSGLNMAS